MESTSGLFYARRVFIFMAVRLHLCKCEQYYNNKAKAVNFKTAMILFLIIRIF